LQNGLVHAAPWVATRGPRKRPVQAAMPSAGSLPVVTLPAGPGPLLPGAPLQTIVPPASLPAPPTMHMPVGYIMHAPPAGQPAPAPVPMPMPAAPRVEPSLGPYVDAYGAVQQYRQPAVTANMKGIKVMTAPMIAASSELERMPRVKCRLQNEPTSGVTVYFEDGEQVQALFIDTTGDGQPDAILAASRTSCGYAAQGHDVKLVLLPSPHGQMVASGQILTAVWARLSERPDFSPQCCLSLCTTGNSLFNVCIFIYHRYELHRTTYR